MRAPRSAFSHRVSRRRVLSILPAMLGAPALSLSAQSRRDRVPGDTRPPAPIAALSSMRDRAAPITSTERGARIERARRLMADTGLDAIVLTGGTSLLYFSGVRWGRSERLFGLVLPARAAAFVVCPAFETDRAHEQLARGPLAGVEVRAWQEDESPFERIAQGLRDRGIASGRLGIEETTPFVFADSIGAAVPGARVVSATPVTAGCRMIKDAHEIALMRLASQVTLMAYAAVYRSMTDGMTQDQVGDLIAAAYGRLGFPGEASVQVGEYTALPHGSVTPQTVREGTIVMLDDGCSVEGYQSDITRTFVLGRASAKMRSIFDVVRAAQTAALKAARPGMTLETVDGAARRVIVDAGYGPAFTYFTHRVGHGLGMDIHEWPYLVRNNMFGWDQSPTLRPGMVFSDEPGIYIPGEFGVRLEDDMLITETGAELFTPQSPAIDKPF